MADERNPKIVSAEDYAVSLDSGDAIGSSGIVEALKEINRQSESAPVQDSAVGVLDTLQSIASVPLALAPGHKLAHAAERSQWLDQWRSPAYLAERQRDAERVAETTARDGEWAGLVEAFKRSATGVTAVPDVISQAPYLAAIGPLARAMGFAAKAEATGIVSKIVQGTAGTGEGAVANRVAMLSGILEGAGSYGQTEERVLRETGDADEATRQARIAGASALIAGVVLGRATPELEMNPTGLRGLSPVKRQFLSDAVAPTALAVGGEVIEESGMAITNTVTDNVMNGRDPMEGVGGAVGQAAAISSLFAGGMRAPGLVRDTSVAIGLGVVKGLRGLSQNLQDRATTAEQAGTDAATDVLQETLSSAENAAAVPSETSSAGEVIQSTEAVASEVPEFVLDGNAPQTLRRDRRKSNSQAVESVLLNAQYELAIDQTSDEETKNQLIATQTELAEDVEKATQAIEKLSPEAVAARVDQEDEQSQMLVEAVRLTDVTKIPESARSSDEQAIVEAINEYGNSNVDAVAQQIFETGFAGKKDSRGIRGFLQSILNYGRLIGDKPNEGSQNLQRFVRVLEDRAQLFQTALDQIDDQSKWSFNDKGTPYIEVTGTRTLNKKGELTDEPFKLWVKSASSKEMAERVLADAARARGALENARKRFPGMFSGVKAPAAPVATPPAATAPAAPTPSPAAAKVETPAAEDSGLSLEAEEAPVDRTVPDLEANAKKEEGRYPDQPKRPESTRIEDEKGLIDVDMRGDTWIGTNNYSNPKEAEKGDGLQRLLTVLRMAKAAGKKYNSDQSLSGSALGMYMKAIKDGVITATSRVSQKDLEDALAGRDGIRTTDSTTIDPEMSVFQDVQIVEQVAPAAVVEPTVQETPAPKAAKPKKVKPPKPHKNATLLKRLTKEAIENITEMVRYARWEQRGGGIIRENEDYKSAVIGRLPWLPSVLWWNDIARKDNGDPFVPLDDSKEVVAKAVRIAEAVRSTGKSREWLGSNQEAFINALLDLIEAEQASRQLDLELPAATGAAPVAAETPTTLANVVSLDAKRKAAGKERPLIDQVVSAIQQLFPNAKLLDLAALDVFLEKEESTSTVDALAAYLEKHTSSIVQNLQAIATAIAAGVSTAFLTKQREKALEVLKFMPSDIQNGFLSFWTSLSEGASYMEAFNALPDTTDGFVLATLAMSDQYNGELDEAQQKRISKPVVAESPTPTVVEEGEAREDAPPSLSDEEMDSLMVSAEEDQESWFEVGEETATTEETETEQASNPLTVEPLAEGQSWLNPTFLDAFKLNPVKSVKAMMTKLLQAARNDGAYLTRYAANVRPALDKVFAAGIAKKFADAGKLETYLKRPFGVFAQAIVRNADGSLEVHPAIRDALAHAAVLQLHRAPDQYDKDSLVDPKTDLPIRSAQVHAWARAIARDTALLLGMKPNKKESEALTQGVLLSLALSTVQALVDNTDVVLTQVEGINVVYPSDAALATWKNHPKLVDNVANIIGAPRVYTASTTPSTNIPERVNHSSTQTSESQKTSIQNLNSVPHYMNPIMMRMLEIVGQAGFNRLATGITWRDKLPEPIQKWLKAKITGITSEIRAANHYQQMLGKAVNDPLFWEYGIDSNGRMNSFMGPQGYTLLRDLFSSARATINLTNAIHVAKTELAIAQALNIKLDQTTLEIEKAYRKKVAEVGDAAKKLVTAIKKANDLDPEAPDYASEADALGREVMATLERGTPLKPRELAGMITLGELLLAQEAGQTELVTFLPIEVDGKTNGAVNAELLYGLGGTISEVNLEQGGVFLTDGTPNWGERITYIIDKWKDKDLYLRVARTAVPLFQSGMGERLEDAGLSYWDELMDGPPANDFGNSEIDNETLTELLIATDMLTADGTAFQREAAKRASNPTVYGAGKLGVASQLIADMRNNLISKWVALDFELQKSPKNAAEIKAQMDRLEALLNMDKSIWEEAALTAGSALLEAYKIQKPNVTRVTALMVKLTSFAFALKLAQWSGMHEELLMSDPRNVAIMEEFKKTPAYQTYLKTGKGRPNLWPASREQYQDILNNTFRLRFATSANPEMVNLDDAENNPSAFRVEGLGTSFSASLDLPQPANPRVSALALTTIGAGDASMVTLFLQQFRQITNVWDGIEMIPTEVDSLSVELNKAAWDAVQFDVLEAYEQTATLLRQRLETLTPEMQQAVLATYNNLVPKFYRYNTFFTDPNVQRAGKPVPGLHEAVRELEQELIRERAAQLKGQAELRAKPIHFVQMANGNGYSPGQQTRDATASPERQAGWSDAIDGAFQALGDKAGRQSVINMLDNVKWNRIQAFVWKRLKPLLPAGLTVSFARNAQQWTELTGKNDYGLVNGRTFIDGDRVVLATAAPHIMLHEVMHATLTKLIANYAINPASVPAHVRTAVNNLMQLLPAFRALKDPRLKTVQNQIWKLQDVWQDTAAAVDEMMTYVLTEPDVMNAVSPKFFQRLVMRVKEVFWSFLGKEVPNSFLDEVLKNFTALTNDIISEDMGSPIAGTYRDSLNTLDALAQRALDGLAQVAAKRPGMKVGNIVDDSMIKAVMKAYTLTPEQHGLHRRIYTLLKLNARKGDLEQFVSTVLPKHPQANLFNGAVDLTASVLALAAVEPTFAAQLEKIYQEERGEVKVVESLIDKVLDANQRPTVEGMVTDALNAIAMDSEYELSLLGTLTHSADRFGQRILEKVGEKAEEWAEDAPRGISDALQGVNALLTEDGAEAFGRGLMDYVNTLTNNQALQSLIGALVGSQNDTNAVYRQVKRFKSMVARTRAEFTTVLPQVLKNLFPETFEGWNDLYEHFARLGVEVLNSDAALMFTDSDARKRMITALESKVPNKWDAQNLAHYMVYGKLPENTPHKLLRNARAIADNLNGTPVTATDDLVADVDQLVTLYAIEALPEKQRAKIAGYFKAHPGQMQNLIGLLQKVREEEDKGLTSANRYIHWKGELPLTTDPRHSIVIAGRVQGAKLEQLGYTRGDKYQQSAEDPQKDLYYYTRPYAPPPVFAQGILATVQQTAKGVNYTTSSTITPEVNTMITERRLVEAINRNPSLASKLIPVHNYQGQVVGYERMLDRQKVRDYTNSNNTLLHISIGQKLGRILEERWAVRFNKEAIQILVNQWEDGKRRGTENQYESVNSTTSKQIARAWEVVPGHIKKQLETAFGGPVMIRRDLIENTLGYYNAGVGDVYTGNASLSEETRKAMIGLTQTLFGGPRAAQILAASEAAIKEGVGTARDWIIVRSISVAYNNFMASLHLVVANGVPIRDVIKYYRQGMADIRVYNRLQVENIELMVKIAAAQGTEKARLQTLQKNKMTTMKRLAIYPLIESGELSDLPEGLIEAPDNTYLGDFTGWLNKKMSHIHPKMPMVVANIAIAKDSQFHDTLSKAIQAGDFLGRYAVYQHMVNTGQGQQNAIDKVRDEFVAYAINPGRMRGYLENMGVVHWTQFTIRAQKVLLNRLRQNPFSFFMSQMASGVTGADGPLEMAVTERGLDNSIGIDNTFGAMNAHIYSKLL